MSPLILAIISGSILSFNTVLIKIYLNNYNVFRISSLLNLKSIFLTFLIVFIGLLGYGLWIIALQQTELTSIYWVSSIYYLLVPLFSLFLLKENISSIQFMGYLIIAFGSIFASAK